MGEEREEPDNWNNFAAGGPASEWPSERQVLVHDIVVAVVVAAIVLGLVLLEWHRWSTGAGGGCGAGGCYVGGSRWLRKRSRQKDLEGREMMRVDDWDSPPSND